MADILKVIQDVLKLDAQAKREERKIMREVQKKLKEKDSEEVTEKSGDKEEYQQFVTTMLKKFGVKSPAELAPDKKKEFYDALDAGWEADDEKPEPEDKKKEESLGDRVQARMKKEEDEELPPEDEDEDPVGDGESDAKAAEKEPEEEPEGEDEPDPDDVEGEKLDRLADLVIQKLKDKASDEDEEMNAPDETEAEQGEEEEIEQNPKVESADLHRNPHSRKTWAEALRKVYQTEEKKNLEEAKVPAPIPEVIKSVGKQLRDYALKSGGIDKGDFLRVSDEMQKGKIPKASLIPSDTEPREFVHDLMAKTFGWKFVEQEYGITFLRRRDYVESFQGGHKLQEHCGECEMGLQEEVSEKDFDALKKGDTITIDFKSSMSSGKSTFKVTAKNIVGKAKVHKATLQNVKNPKSVKFYLYKRGNKVSLAQGDMAASVVKYTIEEVELDEASDVFSKLADKMIKYGKLKKNTDIKVIQKFVKDYLGSDLDKSDLEKISKATHKKLSEEVEINEEVFYWYIVQGNTQKGKVSHVGTERQLKLKIRKPIFPSGHILLKSRRRLKVGDKWKYSYMPEGFELDEGWKKGKYTIKDKNGKILGTYNSGGKAQKAMDDLMQKGDYDKLEVSLVEEAPANSTGSAVVGTGDDPTVWKKKKNRKNAKVKTEEFGGKKVFIVSPEKFWNARMGKSRYTRYEKYVGNDKLGEAIRQFGRENPKAPIILKNSENGAMLYLKYGGRI